MADQYLVDTGSLVITEVSRLSGPQRDPDEMLESATVAVKKLFGEILRLPKKIEPSKGGGSHPVYEMPVPEMRLPREKSAPKEKLKTSWDLFAEKKGIKKTKKQNKVFDEERQEWVDRHGKRAAEVRRAKDWIREVKPNYTPGEGGDPFGDEQIEKKKKMTKEKKGAEKNRRRAEYDALAQSKAGKLNKTLSSLTTASLGTFDKLKKKKK